MDDTPLSKGPDVNQHAVARDTTSKSCDHMLLHLSHAEGRLGVTFNDIAQDAAFDTSTWLFVPVGRRGHVMPLDDRKDSSSSPPQSLPNLLRPWYGCKKLKPLLPNSDIDKPLGSSSLWACTRFVFAGLSGNRFYNLIWNPFLQLQELSMRNTTQPRQDHSPWASTLTSMTLLGITSHAYTHHNFFKDTHTDTCLTHTLVA
jgi:hypothetical protein